RHLGELELGSTPGADRIMEHDDPPAARTLPPELAVLPSVADGGQQPEERNQAGDQKPREKRAALYPPHHPAGEAEEEGNDQVGHVRKRRGSPCRRSWAARHQNSVLTAQMSATTTATVTMVQKIAITKPTASFTASAAATISTRPANILRT